MSAKENMTYYKTAKHHRIFCQFKNVYFWKKNTVCKKIVGLRFGQVRHPLNLKYGLPVNSTDLNHTYFIAINTHLKYLLTNNSPYQSLIEIFQNILEYLA